MSKFSVVLAALLVAVGAVGAVVHLQAQSTASRDGELRLAEMQLQLREIQDVPWQAAPAQGRQAGRVRRQFEAARRQLERDLADEISEGIARDELARVAKPLHTMIAPLRDIIGFAQRDDAAGGSVAAGVAWGHAHEASEAVTAAADRYRATSASALTQALYGSTAAIALLFAAFAFFLGRAERARGLAERLAAENHGLLEDMREHANTDALTGLANRRALTDDLEEAIAQATTDDGIVLALFDLDGFKSYNDTFGHPAGDALLERLGARLTETMQGLGRCYRMGGDEFCVLTAAGADDGAATVRLAAAALHEDGEAFSIGCSYGTAVLPRDADTAKDALRVADQHMYGQKASGRPTAARQTTDVLLRVLGEQAADLESHVDDVGRLAELVARRLSLPEPDVQSIKLAAELHDVGKSAIPVEILSKPGALDEVEWEFMRRHTLIGERIVLAAPSLAHTASLIRASHERVDGQGYPDNLAGDDIPLGARIIAVCDAYSAMVSDRPYRNGMSQDEAVAELHRCAGTQFDPEVVQMFEALVRDDAEQLAA